MTNETNDHIGTLSDAILELGNAMSKMSSALKDCREAGMKDGDIRDAIMLNLPEEDRPAFMMQWPMISMMFAAL